MLLNVSEENHMKTFCYALALLILNCTISAKALGADVDYDLTTADKAIQSFFAAIKAKDAQGVEAMLSPRIKKILDTKKFTLQDYIKAWAKSPPVEIGKAVKFPVPDSPWAYAKAENVYFQDGKKVKYSVRVGPNQKSMAMGREMSRSLTSRWSRRLQRCKVLARDVR